MKVKAKLLYIPRANEEVDAKLHLFFPRRLLLVDDQTLFLAKGSTVSVEQRTEWAADPVCTHYRISSAKKRNIPLLSIP